MVGIDGEGDGTLELKDNLNESADLAKANEAKNSGKTVCAYIVITDKLHEQLAVTLGPIGQSFPLKTSLQTFKRKM